MKRLPLLGVVAIQYWNFGTLDLWAAESYTAKPFWTSRPPPLRQYVAVRLVVEEPPYPSA